MSDNVKTFTGRGRKLTSRRSVVLADHIAAKAAITVGGIGTILAVLLVAVFLVWVVLPLFLPASTSRSRTSFDIALEREIPLHVGMDDYGARWAGVLLPSRRHRGGPVPARLRSPPKPASQQLLEPGLITSLLRSSTRLRWSCLRSRSDGRDPARRDRASTSTSWIVDSLESTVPSGSYEAELERLDVDAPSDYERRARCNGSPELPGTAAVAVDLELGDETEIAPTGAITAGRPRRSRRRRAPDRGAGRLRAFQV